MNIKKCVFVLIAFCLCLNSFAQDSVQDLPRGYSDITLGLSLEDAKQNLTKNKIFGYRGERDVSLLPIQERVLIETEGSSFFNRCYFQFYDEKLYAITLNINSKHMDYYSMFTTLKQKYGEPATFTPNKAEWKNDTVTMTLEKPLTIKYIDSKVYDDLIDQGKKAESTESILRQKFLETF